MIISPPDMFVHLTGYTPGEGNFHVYIRVAFLDTTYSIVNPTIYVYGEMDETPIVPVSNRLESGYYTTNEDSAVWVEGLVHIDSAIHEISTRIKLSYADGDILKSELEDAAYNRDVYFMHNVLSQELPTNKIFVHEDILLVEASAIALEEIA